MSEPACAVRTHPGLVREENEDVAARLRLPDASLYVVADGMGAARSGAFASTLAVRTLLEAMSAGWHTGIDDGDAEALLRTAYARADAALLAQNDNGATTLVSLVLRDDRTCLVGNIGDSRGYLWRDGRLAQLTRDHTLVQQWIDEGRLRPEEARESRYRNVLVRAVGIEPHGTIDVFRPTLAPGTRILLCSSGLWDGVDDPAIEAILGDGPPEATAETLVRAALGCGGHGNITVIVVDVPA